MKIDKLFQQLEKEEKLIVYTIGLFDDPIRTKVKLQKILFLVSNVFPDYSELLDFDSHLLGPFSESIESVCEELIKLELVGKKGSKFSLTSKGMELFKKIKPSKELEEIVKDFKNMLNDLSDKEILVFVYVTYPQFIGESAVWEELKQDRVKYAISLLRKEKISFMKASELAGMKIKEFRELLKTKNIKWKNDNKNS